MGNFFEDAWDVVSDVADYTPFTGFGLLTGGGLLGGGDNSITGYLTGTSDYEDSLNQAKGEQERSTIRQLEYLENARNQARADLAGQRALFGEAMPYLRGMAFGPNYQAPTQTNALSAMGEQISGLPNVGVLGTRSPIGTALRGVGTALGQAGQQQAETTGMAQIPGGTAVPEGYVDPSQYFQQLTAMGDYDFSQNPIYQAMADEMSKRVRRGAASRGGLYSSSREDIEARNLAPLMQQAFQTEYGRRLDALNAANQLSNQQFGRLYNLANLGAAGAGGQAQAALQTGGQISSVLGNQANALSNLALQQGQQAMANSPLNMITSVGQAALPFMLL